MNATIRKFALIANKLALILESSPTGFTPRELAGHSIRKQDAEPVLAEEGEEGSASDAVEPRTSRVGGDDLVVYVVIPGECRAGTREYREHKQQNAAVATAIFHRRFVQ